MKKYIFIVTLIFFLAFLVFLHNKLQQPVRELPTNRAVRDIAMLDTGVRTFKLNNGFYPTTEQGLKALIKKPTIGKIPLNWRQKGYIKTEDFLIDPWGNEYIYKCPGEHSDFDITSYGEDGKIGGDGDNNDITN